MKAEVNINELPAMLAKEAALLNSLDYRPLLKTCSYLIANDTQDNFQEQHDPDGVPWKPIKPRPQQRGKGQRNRSPAGTTHALIDTGHLRRSTGSGAPNNIEQIGQFELIYGTNVSYAAVHQNGATIPARNRKPPQKAYRFPIFAQGGDKIIFSYKIKQTTIPARPFLGLGETLLDKIDGAIGVFMENNLFVVR